MNGKKPQIFERKVDSLNLSCSCRDIYYAKYYGGEEGIMAAGKKFKWVKEKA